MRETEEECLRERRRQGGKLIHEQGTDIGYLVVRWEGRLWAWW